MDTLRGSFDPELPADTDTLDDSADIANEAPPPPVGQDERRMQVRAYNHWAAMLGERQYPDIADLEPTQLSDFGPHSVLLDFSDGIEDPKVRFCGEKLAEECGANGPIKRLSDVPPRSLLSRITDHYMQILANEAPIGFEAEFTNNRGTEVLYRGILLPYSSDDSAIDYLLGVINWKEIADQLMADELLLEIDQALGGEDPAEDKSEDAPEEYEASKHQPAPLANWADSPAFEGSSRAAETPAAGSSDEFLLDEAAALTEDPGHPRDLPKPSFGQNAFDQYLLDDPDEDPEDFEAAEGSADDASYSFASLADHMETIGRSNDAGDLHWEDEALEPDAMQAALAPEAGAEAGLHDHLAAARELANSAQINEDRSRHTLYEAVGRAYDFSLAARSNEREYRELITDSGLTLQERAPMTPVVKLVFGANYEKTRLTEYAAVLSHAHRLELERGALAPLLKQTEGGLKAIVKAERRLRREEKGKPQPAARKLNEKLAEQLRKLEPIELAALGADGPEFGLIMLKRCADGTIALLGEIGDEPALVEKAARKLTG